MLSSSHSHGVKGYNISLWSTKTSYLRKIHFSVHVLILVSDFPELQWPINSIYLGLSAGAIE